MIKMLLSFPYVTFLNTEPTPITGGEQSGLSAMLVALNYELREAVDLLLEYGAVPSVEPAKIVYNYDPLGFKKYDENFDETWQSELHLFAANGYVDLLMPYIESGQVRPLYGHTRRLGLFCLCCFGRTRGNGGSPSALLQRYK